MINKFKAPEFENLIFWSIYTSDPENNQLAIFPDDVLATEMVKHHVANHFSVPIDDVVIKIIYHNSYEREVIGAYLKIGHRNKVIGKIEEINRKLTALMMMMSDIDRY